MGPGAEVRTPEIELQREAHFDDDITTWLAEVLDGQMHTEFAYRFDGEELYGRDGRALMPIFRDAVIEAQKIAAENPDMDFEVRRRWLEAGEYRDMIDMAKGDQLNTMVVVSDFPPELMGAHQDVGGYNVRRKQAFLRVITADTDGRIVMRSQSLDRSDRQALEQIFITLGAMPTHGELLGQRIHVDLDADKQEELMNMLITAHDEVLSTKYGGNWYAGRTPADIANTYDFVCAQEDLLSAFEAASYVDGNTKQARYNLAAAMRKRFTAGEKSSNLIYWSKNEFSLDPATHEMQNAGREARMAGVVFSGCGETLGTVEEMARLGYGNKSDEDQYGSLTFECGNGHRNIRPRGQLIPNCTSCGMSVRC